MKKLFYVQLLALFASAQVVAEPAEFTKADADKDGILSISEAKEALPDLVIVDVNDDGLFNLEEAAMSIPELDATVKASSELNPEGLVGQSEYQQILQVLSNRRQS